MHSEQRGRMSSAKATFSESINKIYDASIA